MSNTIVDSLNELRSQPTAQRRAKTLASSNDAEEQQVWARYHEAVSEVRQAWGEPELGPVGSAYEGPGWRAGYKGECPSQDDNFRQVYCKALRIGWWTREGFVHAVLVTGHDANTLQILQMAAPQTE